MSQTTQTLALVAPSVRRGFGYLPCPRCGEESATVTLALPDLFGEEAVVCAECEAAFSLDEVRTLLARWAPVVAWAEAAPALPDA